MRENPSRFLRLQKELLGLRLSNSAKFNGTIISKKKQHGKEKTIFGKTTLTYLLANPNLEGEIHLKGFRFVTSLKSCFKTHAYHPCIHDHLGFLFKTNSKTGASDAHYFMWETITQMPLSIERLFVLNQALLALLLFWLNVGVWIKIYKTNMV